MNTQFNNYKPSRVVLIIIASLVIIFQITKLYYGINESFGFQLIVKFFGYISVSFHVFFLVWVIFIISEGDFSSIDTPYTILRRRIDEAGAPWEDLDLMILEYDSNQYTEYYEYHSSFFSSDGFFPRSYGEIGEIFGDTLRVRIQSLSDAAEFCELYLPRMSDKFNNVTLTHMPNTNSNYRFFKLDPFRDSIHCDNMIYPAYFDNIFSYDFDIDYSDIGISLISGSAEDGCSYDYDIEQPVFFPPDLLYEYFTKEDTQYETLLDEAHKMSSQGLSDISYIGENY
jgi:hypothetical protein